MGSTRALLFTRWMAGALLGLLAFNLSAYADDNPIHIRYLNDYQSDQQLLLDSSIRFSLPDEILKAVQHEIPLTFETEIELNEVHPMLGIEIERNRVHIRYQTQLRYIGFNRRYIISNRRNNQVQAFENLKDALQTLGTLSNFKLTDLADLHPDTTYIINMRVRLNKWELPTPLIIDSLFRQNWHLDSGWRSIEIQSPKSWL